MNTVQPTETLTIGKLAAAAGVNVETIRYYQREHLLEEPQKPAQGYRIYAPEMIARLQFIKRAKQLGFTLREIRELLALEDGQCQQVQQIAEEKVDEIAARIRDLQAMQGALTALLQGCGHDQQTVQCGLLSALKR